MLQWIISASSNCSLFVSHAVLCCCLPALHQQEGVETFRLILLLHLKAIKLWSAWQWSHKTQKACWISYLVHLSGLLVFCSGWGAYEETVRILFSAKHFFNKVSPVWMHVLFLSSGATVCEIMQKAHRYKVFTLQNTRLHNIEVPQQCDPPPFFHFIRSFRLIR